MYNEKKIEMIEEILDKLRPFLHSDGGDLEFIEYKGDIVYIRMLGACQECHLIDQTIKDGIEMALKSEVDENIIVINVI